MDIAQIGQNYDYVALGHIHKAQNLNLRARYAGSPIAMSFDEVSRDYRHSISIVEIAHRGAQPVIREVEITPSIPLVNIPAEDAAEWQKVLAELKRFPEDIPALIRIKVLLPPDEILPYNYEWQVKEALAGKLARHCDTHVQRQLKDDTATPTQESVKMELSELKNMQPIEVARKWMERKGMQMTPEMEELFNYAMQQALESERYED
jgi:exonuclease SbcD